MGVLACPAGGPGGDCLDRVDRRHRALKTLVIASNEPPPRGHVGGGEFTSPVGNRSTGGGATTNRTIEYVRAGRRMQNGRTSIRPAVFAAPSPGGAILPARSGATYPGDQALRGACCARTGSNPACRSKFPTARRR